METINIQFTLFSAFYSPLIATLSGGFLKDEGLDGKWSVAAAGTSALTALEDGSAHVVQSALSQGFTAIEKGQKSNIRHFAQVNEMDGFFLTAKNPDTDFNWSKLEGAQQEYFPEIDNQVLTDCIATYQRLGNWSPHIEITDSAYEATLDIYQYAGGLKQRHPYNDVCCKPPVV